MKKVEQAQRRHRDLLARRRFLERDLKDVQAELERLELMLTSNDFEDFDEPSLPDVATKLGQMLVLLASAPEKSWVAKDIFAALGVPKHYKTDDKVRKRLIELARRGLIDKVQRGHWKIRPRSITRMKENRYPL